MSHKKTWAYVSCGLIGLSILSLFFPILSYSSFRYGKKLHFNILKLLLTDDFLDQVLGEYTGGFMRSVSDGTATAFVVLISLIGVAAIILAFVGIISMTKQYTRSYPFVLSICGLIGTAIPSLILIIIFALSGNSFQGSVHLGAYVFITPLSMLLACITVSRRYALTRQQLELLREASQYIYPAGDLRPFPWEGY